MYGENVEQTMEILSCVQATDGIYGVDGNHDNRKVLFDTMREYGIVPLDNSGVRLRDGLYLGGVQDLWKGKPEVQAAMADAEQDDFKLLLCHNPDVSMKQDTSGADLMLSGHTHGGQATLFGLWAPMLTLPFSWPVSEYGQYFMGGWNKGAYGTDIYVSRGVEPSLARYARVFSPPEVVLLTLKGM